MPARAIADTRLSALDLRCLMAVSIHDGMSLIKKNGPGCFAKSATLAEMVGTDVSNLSKSLSRLITLGYLSREPQEKDKRRFNHRVIYDEGDSWRDHQPKPAGKVGETTNDLHEVVGQVTNNTPEMVGETTNKIVGEPESLSGEKCSENRSYYNQELDFVETNRLYSVETESAPKLPKTDELMSESGVATAIVPSVATADGNALTGSGVVAAWNALAERIGKPPIRKLTPARAKGLARLTAEFKIEDFQEVWRNIERSAFLRGDTGSHFFSFDWLLKPGNFLKILEGNFTKGPADHDRRDGFMKAIDERLFGSRGLTRDQVNRAIAARESEVPF